MESSSSFSFGRREMDQRADRRVISACATMAACQGVIHYVAGKTFGPLTAPRQSPNPLI
jgi:hypothetical protein